MGEQAKVARQRPLKYPLALEDALRLSLPVIRHPDRMKLYRQYLRESLHFRGVPGWPMATDAEVEEQLTNKRIGWFTEARLEALKDAFPPWVEKHQKQLRDARARKAAAARHKKSKKTALRPIGRTKRASSTAKPR